MKRTKVYVLYSYGHKDESVWVDSVFYKKENADEKLNELSKSEKDGRLYYIQTVFLEDLEIVKPIPFKDEVHEKGIK